MEGKSCLLAAFLLSAAVAFQVFAQEKVQVRVNVTSQPSGATVIVDGMDRGTTPVTLFDLTPGRHHIKYRLAGYGEADRFVDTGREGPFIEKNVVLQEEKGLLLLKTDPPGANIVIDGVAIGQTPRLVTHLAAKDTYNVKLRKAGYQEQLIQVRFDGRRPLVREETLVLASGTVNVLSDPAGAEVTVNGIVRGTTPILVREVPRGRAVVKCRLDGFDEECFGRRWFDAVHLVREDVENLAAPRQPVRRRFHRPAVREDERVRQRIRRNPCFVIVDFARGKGLLICHGFIHNSSIANSRAWFDIIPAIVA